MENDYVCNFRNDAAPPVFEQIFKNARFAQGGNAVFEGKVTGIPKPFVSWTRKGAPLLGNHMCKVIKRPRLTFF